MKVSEHMGGIVEDGWESKYQVPDPHQKEKNERMNEMNEILWKVAGQKWDEASEDRFQSNNETDGM